MTVQQKRAWLTLVLSVASVVGYGVLIPMIGPYKALGAFALLGGVALPSILPGWRKTVSSMDERDLLIYRRAQLLGLRIFWVCFVLGTVGTYEVIHYVMHKSVIPAIYLELAVWYAAALFLICSSSATLVMYGRSRDYEA
jgi:hypothetical protein